MTHDRKYDAPEFVWTPGDRSDHNSGHPSGYDCDGFAITGRERCARFTSSEVGALETPDERLSWAIFGCPEIATACNECTLPVPEDDAGPSCGAHILHIECAPWFHCHECYLMRAEIP